MSLLGLPKELMRRTMHRLPPHLLRVLAQVSTAAYAAASDPQVISAASAPLILKFFLVTGTDFVACGAVAQSVCRQLATEERGSVSSPIPQRRRVTVLSASHSLLAPPPE